MVHTKTQAVEKPPIALRLLADQKSRRITLAVLASVILLGGVWYWYDSRVVVDRAVLAEASLKVYSPRQAPDGYRVASDQTSLRQGILSYTFTNDTENSDITVTVQDKPINFDMGQLTHGGTVNSTLTDKGTLYDLSAGGINKYLLDTGTSLIFITTPSDVVRETVDSLVRDLRRVK